MSKRSARTQAPLNITDDWAAKLPLSEAEVSLLTGQMLDLLMEMVEQSNPKGE